MALARKTDSLRLRTSQAPGATGSDQRNRPRRSMSPLSSKVSHTPATCWGLKFKIGNWNMKASVSPPRSPCYLSLIHAPSPPFPLRRLIQTKRQFQSQQINRYTTHRRGCPSGWLRQPRWANWGAREYEGATQDSRYFWGGKKTSSPLLIFYWTWQIGCVVSKDACQSLSSVPITRKAAQIFQHLPTLNSAC